MTTATVTSKGQITIPAPVRAELHVGPGDRIEFVKIDEGRYEVIAATNDVAVLRGLVETTKRATVAEMDAAIKAKASK